MSDQELKQIIEGCQKNDRSAKEQLYKRFSAKMYGVCLRYTKDQTAAEDVLQDGFIKAFRNIKQFSFKGSFEGWLRRIMVNTAIERFRKRNYLHNATEITEAYDLADDYSIMDNLSAKELVDLIRGLTPQYRTVFNLYVVEGYAHKEIAKMLNISEGTSKSNLARARKILQQQILQLNQISTKKIAGK